MEKEIRAKQLDEEKSRVTNSNNNQSKSDIPEKKRDKKEKNKNKEESKTRRSVERNTEINRVIQSKKKANNDRTNRKDDEKVMILRGIRRFPTQIKHKRYGGYGKREKSYVEKSTMILIQDEDCFRNISLEYFGNKESENYNENLFRHYIACSNDVYNYSLVISSYYDEIVKYDKLKGLFKERQMIASNQHSKQSFSLIKDETQIDTISGLLRNEAIKFMLPKAEKNM